MKDKKMFVLFTITLLMMALFTSMIRMDIKEVKRKSLPFPHRKQQKKEIWENVVILLMPSLVWCAVR